MDPNLALFLETARERIRIRDRKDAGRPWPWTDNPWLAKYWFTNVSRDDDKTTRWLVTHLYEPNKHRDWGLLIFNAGVARYINLPETLKEVGFIENYDPVWLFKLLEARKARDEKTVSDAYHNVGHLKLVDHLRSLWNRRDAIARIAKDIGTIEAVTAAIDGVRGWGPFRAFQTALDLTYTPVLAAAPDRDSYAVLGPGSAEGLDIVFDRPHWREVKFSKKSHAEGLGEMRWLQGKALEAGISLKVSDVEHWLCEFSKLWSAMNGMRPRRLYRSSSAPLNDMVDQMEDVQKSK